MPRTILCLALLAACQHSSPLLGQATADAVAAEVPNEVPAAVIDDGNTQQPNLVLFLVDDLGWRDHGMPEREGFGPAQGAGQARFRTPHLNLLAERGLTFTDAYASAPVCTPTRTSIQTGMSPGQSHITYWTQHADTDTSRKHPRLAPPDWRTNGLDADEVTLAKLLRDSGYRTIHVGKAHFGAKGSPCEDPAAVGFTRNIAGHAAGGPGSFLSEHHYTSSLRQGKQYEPTYWDIPGLEKYHDTGTFLTEALALEAIAEIEAAVADGVPFFLNFAPYAVHAPIMANPALLDDDYAALDAKEAAYATMIESVDNALGLIVAKLDELGVTDDTALFYTSDNGGLSAHARGRMPDDTGKHHHNAPLLAGKGSAYEGGTRVPLVAVWPDQADMLQGAISNQPIISHDLFPTFLDLAGVDVPVEHAPKVEGLDIVELATDEALQGYPELRYLYWHQPHQWGANGPGIEPFTSIVHDSMKLIWFHDGPRFELYHLLSDPGETNDLMLHPNPSESFVDPTDGLHWTQEGWPDGMSAWTEQLTFMLDEWMQERGVQPSLVGYERAPSDALAPLLEQLRGASHTRLGVREGDQTQPTPPAPNILLLVVDDLGWADVQSADLTAGNGSVLHRTPHTDRLAETGLAFLRAYAAAPNCAPSRAALHTGQWAARTGVYTVGEPNRGRAELRGLIAAENVTELHEDFWTFAERLPNGYRNVHLGKWHLGGGRGTEDKPGGPLDHGFDENYGGNGRGNPGGKHAQFADEDGAFDLPGLAANGQAGQWVDDRLGDELLAFLGRHAAEVPGGPDNTVAGLPRPFFANLNLYAVHTPVRPTVEDRAAFDGVELAEGARHDDLDYAAYVKGYDDIVGDVIAKLGALDDPRWPGHKLIENTIVVLTSDNGGFGGYEDSDTGLEEYHAGPTNNHPLRGGKGQLYEGGLRVPLVLRWDAGLGTGGEEGGGQALRTRSRNLLVSGTDLAPTLLGLAAVGARAGFDGRDLSGYLLGRQPRHSAQLFWHFPAYLEAGRQGMRTGPASLVRSEDWALFFFYEDRRFELYRDVDLTALASAEDQGESSPPLPERLDLIADPAQRARAERLVHALATHLAETGAAMPTDPLTGELVGLPSVADLPPLTAGE